MKYIPEIMGKAGGRREIRDFYIIKYEGIEKKIQLGSRIITSKEKVTSPEKNAPFREGERLPVAYLSQYPQKVLVNPHKNLFKEAYNSSDNIAFIYLLKVLSFFLLIYSIRIFSKSLLFR